MRDTLKEQLARFLANKGCWESKGALTDHCTWHYTEKGITKTYLAETVGRKLRLLEEESRIAVKSEGSSVQYKFLPTDKRNRYIPWSIRPEGQKNNLFKV